MRWTPPTISVIPRGMIPNRWDLLAFPLILGLLFLLAAGARQMTAPMTAPEAVALSLNPDHLPGYALRTTLRMLAAMAASLLFTFTYATLAAKSRRAELLLIPVLDVLQSVPVLGYVSFTVTFFLSLFPGNLLGAEFAAIFAIFTSQAWNMAFSFYQSLRTVPKDLEEVTRSFHFSAWQRFWRLEVPFAMPGLIWNMMMSMSGGWFFVVAAEAIAVGGYNVRLPGVGSYVALAIERRDLGAIGWAVLTMLVVILAYDQLLFRPLIAWADKFRFEMSAGEEAPESRLLMLFRRARLLSAAGQPLGRLLRRIAIWRGFSFGVRPAAAPAPRSLRLLGDGVWYAIVVAITVYVVVMAARYVSTRLGWHDLQVALSLGAFTLLRVAVLILLATIVWLPLGSLIGLRPRLAQKVQPVAQFLAAFPANLLFPVAVVGIVRFDLNPDIWLGLLMILGAQWYILFNVVAGASAFPHDLRDAATNLRIRGWQWWRQVTLPGVFPYYVTGAITASGGCWNASIVAESVSWGDTHLAAHGLGAYIAQATRDGDFPRIILGIAVMSVYVILFNRLLWRPLYGLAERRFRLD
ncbi:MAG: NitT/TauT family transport system permease protein [Rhodospirillaceae bacterium]|jgi:NitT/TauT family transport system permease protein|nr:NitT/TauT family transport system permease protein [Rhodospirillaceae bacterium]